MTDPLELAGHVADWAPRPVQDDYRVEAWPVAAFADLLDQPVPKSHEGDPIPPMWHVFQSPEHPATRELGVDGHPRDGHFLPPIPHRRRMYAGGRVEFHAPLRVGDNVTRTAELAAVQAKQGRTGEMLFVTVRTTHTVAGQVRVVDEHDLVYRSQPTAEHAPTAQPAQEPMDSTEAPWQLRLGTDPALLFRFSALTYNGHRIHYDLRYATEVEGHPGLIVHGPLLALLLLELPRRFAPDLTIGTFDYRLRRPATAGAPIVAAGSPDELAAAVSGAPPSITGHVQPQ